MASRTLIGEGAPQGAPTSATETKFNAMLALYEAGTPQQRQRVLDMLPHLMPPLTSQQSRLSRELWSDALQDVFGATIEMTDQGEQIVLVGAERSAHQAAAARGPKMRHRAPQRDPGGMFEPPCGDQLSLF